MTRFLPAVIAIAIAIAALADGFLPVLSVAQGRATGEISGTLVDEKTEHPVKDFDLVLWGCGVEGGSYFIQAIKIGDQFPPRAKTSTEGRFAFTGVPEGTYCIAAAQGSISTDSWVTIKQGPLATRLIQVGKGKSIDLGKVNLVRER